jgi:hypothetical protein
MMDVPDSIRDLIIEHHTEGRFVREIAFVVRKSKSTVGRIIKRYSESGEKYCERKGRCGHCCLLTCKEGRLLGRASKTNPEAIGKELQASVGGNVSSVSINTVKRALRRQERRCTALPSVPASMLSKEMFVCNGTVNINSGQRSNGKM